VWVSELALILRPRNGVIEGFVLEGKSGDPVPGAQVTALHFDRNAVRVPHLPVATDENGFFTFLGEQNLSYIFRVQHNDRELVSQNEYAAQQRPALAANSQTIFFTDRAIYRPGQIIQYKGICLRVDQDKDNYHTIADADVEVIFDDPNGKEIARQKHRCNDYGSFTGSFTAPGSRVTGRMSLRVVTGPQGAASFSVEEYKRPK